MQLKRIEIAGFKSIRDLPLDLRSLNILIGANGAGKSNFVTLFRLLNEMIEGRFQIAVRQGGGANAFLHFGAKETEHIHVLLYFGPNEYECDWIPTVDDTLIFRNEVGYFQGVGYAQPYSEGYGGGHTESVIKTANTRISRYIYDSMKTWKVYHFHDTSDSASVKRLGDINDNFYLRADAANLAAFLYKMQRTFSAHYETIRSTIRLVAPFFDDFILRPLTGNEDKIRLEWKATDSDFPFLAHQLSDGTLRFICLATLLLQPILPSTILIDEPELGLHPYAITVLAGLMRSASTRTQVIATTQSVPLVNEFEAEDLITVELQNKQSVFHRVEGEKLTEWLSEYKLGELWQKNVLGGRPTR